MRPCRDSITRQRRKLKKMRAMLDDGRITFEQVRRSYPVSYTHLGDWESAKEHAANAYESIKNNITGKLDSAKGTAVSIADQIGDKLGFPGLGDTVGGVFDAVKSAIEDPIGTAKN